MTKHSQPINLLMLVMDDQRADTIRALGNPQIDTPNLDQLAQRGSFLRPYTTVPVCTPARAELLTGCNAFANGCRWFGEPIKSGTPLLPRVLAEAGYHCAHIGKWHNDGHPRDRGYHQTRRVWPSDTVVPYYRDGDTWRGSQDLTFEENGRQIRGHSTELFAEAALDFLNQAPRNPWFCFVGLHSPHDPRTAPPPYDRWYENRPPPLPPNFMPEHPFDNGDMLIRDELLAPFPRTPAIIQKELGDYYAMITHHDHHLGRILSALEQTGQRERTLVVFTSDHGLAIGSHGLMGKENLYEHSARVPLIFAGPNVPAAQRLDDKCLCGHEDFMPTVLELLGLPVPPACTGQSYADALRGERPATRETVRLAYRDCMRAVTDGRFKLIEYPKIGRTQLFDLAHDPHETCDLLAEWRYRSSGHINWPYTPRMEAAAAKTVAAKLRATASTFLSATARSDG